MLLCTLQRMLSFQPFIACSFLYSLQGFGLARLKNHVDAMQFHSSAPPGAPPALSPSVARGMTVLACGCSGTWGPAGLPLCQLGSPCDFSLRGPACPALSCSSDGLLRPWATPVLRRSLVRLLLMSGALALWRSAPPVLGVSRLPLPRRDWAFPCSAHSGTRLGRFWRLAALAVCHSSAWSLLRLACLSGFVFST